MKALLVQPRYESKYPPLGLMKIATYLKRREWQVEYFRGLSESIDLCSVDKVFITSLFTYDIDIVNETVRHYKEKCTNAEILLGGIAATLMDEQLNNDLGVKLIKGIWDEVEFSPPDYSMFSRHPWGDYSFVFTTRGCPNKCSFCAVKTLEPDCYINPTWKEHISSALSNIMIHDNNLTSFDLEHFAEVMSHLSSLHKPVVFDNGFDCRLFTKEHSQLLSTVNIQNLRFAFDSLAQDGYIQNAINLCKRYGIPASKILVYVLYNYSDADIQDALYRATEVARLGARPYAMKYIPLSATQRDSYYSPSWDKNLSMDFFEFVNKRKLVGAVDFFEWRKKWKLSRSNR